jgi:hypothetical protein
MKAELRKGKRVSVFRAASFEQDRIGQIGKPVVNCLTFLGSELQAPCQDLRRHGAPPVYGVI